MLVVVGTVGRSGIAGWQKGELALFSGLRGRPFAWRHKACRRNCLAFVWVGTGLCAYSFEVVYNHANVRSKVGFTVAGTTSREGKETANLCMGKQNL